MPWFSRLFTAQEAARPALTARQQELVAAWRQLPEPDMRRSSYRCRYVVVDVETTGIDLKNDRVCSIAAVAVVDGQIDFKNALQLVLQAVAPSADVDLIAAGAPRPEQINGGQAAEALISFLQFVGKAPFVTFKVPFVAGMIERELGECLGFEPGLPWIDLAWVMPDLFRDLESAQGGLDAWLEHFGIDSISRHHAVSDAYAIAQLLQITIAHGARKGFGTPASLLELEKARRHMHQSG